MPRFTLFMSCVLLLCQHPLRLEAMDQARLETRIDDAVSAYGVTGRGVVVALIDRGIDWKNNDFRNGDGSTRIAWIYDLTDDSGSNAPANPYHLGTIYPGQQVNDALKFGTNLVTRDALGHGTTTAGISCGNGRNLSKYRGAAPEATIIAVKIVAENVPAHGNQPAETPFYDPNRIPVAIQFVKDKARDLGMPCVMLLNIGSSTGPMDGTSRLCQAINSAVGPGIPGVVFVTGASDDGGMANHASGALTTNGDATIQVHKGNSGVLLLDLWYSSADLFDVSIQTPTNTYGPYSAPASNTTRDTQTTGDFLYYQLGGSVNFSGTVKPEREIWMRLLGPVGDYAITLKGRKVVDGRFNASLNPSQYWNPAASSNYFTSFVGPGGTVWDLASASNNICPNNYVHRTQYVDIDGITRPLAGTLGELWTGSGTGPTYDGRFGVDVSAPGESVFTCYNPDSYFATFRFNLVQGGSGLYGRANAVSAASPMVTGIIALMLQMNPQLDAAQVKSILQQTARADTFTGVVPNNKWGYGKVDAYSAVAMAATTLPPFSLTLVSGEPPLLRLAPVTIGLKYVLQVSTDLVSWHSVMTNSAASNSVLLQDLESVTGSRFYRSSREL